MFVKNLLSRVFSLFLCAILLSGAFHIEQALAASLTAMSDSLSNNHVDHTSVSHTVSFTTATTANLKRIEFQFSTTSGGSTKPAGLGLGSATLASTGGLSSGWVIDTTSAASGLLAITNSSPPSIGSSTAASVQLDGITNSSMADCQASSGGLFDICYVNITTIDNGDATVDTGTTTYTVVDDPFLTFELFGVNASVTTNGVTTSVTSTISSIPFGRLTADEVRYAAQQIKVSTNATNGYTVYMYVDSNLDGTLYHTSISPFGAVNATWTTPQSWSTPNGTTPGSNTGWFGANTNDTRVTGWSSGTSGKFGPVSTTKNAIDHASGPDPSGTLVTISYALGVNAGQPADTYSGTIIYEVRASY